MSPIKVEVSWDASADAMLPVGRSVLDQERSHAGWWLLPSLLSGTALWVWAISAIIN